MKSLKTISALAVLTLTYQSTALADMIEAKVIKSSNESSRIIVQTEDAELITKGERLEFGSRCTLEVIGSSTNKIILSTQDCQNTKALKVGNTLALEMEESKGWNASSNNSSSNTSSSQVTSTSKARVVSRPLDPMTVSRGVRVSLAKPDLDAKVKFTVDGMGSDSSKDNADAKYNLAVGYANVGVRRIGVITGMNYTVHDGDESEDVKALRAEGSMAYGFNQNLYSFGGLNLNKFTNTEIKELDPRLGFQLGVGLQATPTLGFELKYLEANNKGNLKFSDGLIDVNVNTEIKMKGIEFGVHATF